MASKKVTKKTDPKSSPASPAKGMIRKDDGTLEFHITIPKDKIEKTREEIIAQVVASAKIPGFRPGKAPRKVVEDSISPEKVREEVLQKLIPQLYIEAVQKEGVRPIVNPKIHVEKIEEGTDWEFTASTCEMPEVKLGEYKKAVQAVTAKNKIVVPGKEEAKPNLDEIVKAVIDNVQITIPKLLIEHEADRLLSQTLDEIKRLGLTLDQYLASTNKTPEDLRKDYEGRAVNDMTIEFALAKISDSEKISVSDTELTEAIEKAKDPKEKAHMESNKYLLASILRQQKTLDFLSNL